MLKHISQLASMAEYKKACSGDGKIMSDKPTPFVFFPKFAFSKTSNGPVLLLGSVPGSILAEAKKKGGACITGKASIKEGKVELEGTSSKVSASAMNTALASVGVSKKVSTTSAEDDESEGVSAAPKTKFPDPLKAPPKGPEPLKSKPLGSAYKDEDKKMGWRAQARPDKKDTDLVTTKYFNEDETKESAIGFDEKGRMVDADGNKMRSKSVGFVGDASAEGQLRQFKLGENSTDALGRKKFTHHSSPVKGGAVTGAGQISTKRSGRLEEITDQSGHYKPGAELTHQTVKKMGEAKDAEGFEKNLVDRSKGADGPINKPAKVTLVGKQGFTEEEWESIKDDNAKVRELAKKKFGNDVTFEDDELGRNTLQSINMRISDKTKVSLTTQQFLQTEGNEKQIRSKMALNKELEEKGKKKRDELDGPVPAEPSQKNSGMSAADFKKLGGTPATLKEATKNAKPTVRLSEKGAQKVAADAVAKDNSSRAGKTLGPQKGILGQRPVANGGSGGNSVPASNDQVVSLGYLNDNSASAPDADDPLDDAYSTPILSNKSAPKSPLRSSTGSDGYSAPKLTSQKSAFKPFKPGAKNTPVGYSTPGAESDDEDESGGQSPLRSSTGSVGKGGYAVPNLGSKKGGPASATPGSKNTTVGYSTPGADSDDEDESEEKSPLRSSTGSVGKGGYAVPNLGSKKGGPTSATPGSKNTTVGYSTPGADSDDEDESEEKSPLRSSTGSDGYSQPNLSPKKGGYAPFKPGKKK